MHINTDISAASNGAYQIRTRQANIPSFDNPNPRAVLAQQSQANRAAATKPADSVQLSSSAAAALTKQANADTAASTNKPAPNILEAIIKPGAPAEAPAQSQSDAAPPSFTVADLEAMLELFGQSYDLEDADNADPQVVQYDLNGDGTIDTNDLGTMLGMIQ